MNREIKFRAWDVKFQVMLPSVAVFNNENICVPDTDANELYGDDLDERLDTLNGDVPEWYLMTGGFDLMQYTGLKDKNGVEIYEGDIIIRHDAEKPFYYLVEWDSENAKFFGKGKPYIFSAINFPKMAKVVGNIYQHPHLLESKEVKP